VKGDPEMRKAVLNRLRREHDEAGCVSNELVRQAAHRLSMSTRQVRRLVVGTGKARKPRFALTSRQVDVLFSVNGTATLAYEELDGTPDDPGVSLRVFQRAVADLDPAVRATASHGWGGAIRRFVYASKDAPYRGHTYCIDHTPAPVAVVAYRGSAEWFYPWVTIVWDEAKKVCLAGDAVQHDPQAETTRDVLITAIEGFALDDGTWAGGMPEFVLSDRGSDLIGDINGLGLIRTGIGRKYSPPGESFQNGVAEKNLGLLQDEMCRKTVGFRHGARDSYSRSHPVQPQPENLLTLDQFRALLARWMHRWNEERVHGSLDGRTPAQAWAQDEQVVPAADPVALRLAMMKADKTAKIGKNGVRFDGEDYVHLTKMRLHFGKQVEIRYLPRRKDFIEVFINGQHLCRATLRKAQTDEQKGAMAADRKEVKKAFTAHALEGARIAAERTNNELRETGFPEDGLPKAPTGEKGRTRAKPATAGSSPVTENDLDRLDRRLGSAGHRPSSDDDGQRDVDATGTEG